MKVLLIENDASLQRALGRMLRRMFDAADIYAADGAGLAIEYLKDSVVTKQFDLVISDFDLIGMRTGGDVLEWVEEHTPHLLSRFLFLSGNPKVQNRGVRWIDKADDVAKFKKTIQEMLNPVLTD